MKYHLPFFCAIKMIYFLERIVTYDEKWILYNNRRRLTHWLDHDETPQHFPKPKFHQKKIIMIVWWSVASLIHHNFLAKLLQLKCTVNSMKCTKNFVCVQYSSTEMVLSFSTIMLRYTLSNRFFKNWTNWPTKLYFIHIC